MRKLLAVLGVLAVLAGVGAYFLFTHSGRIVKEAIEAFGPKVLGAPVRVRAVRLSPLSGRGSIHGLVIGNPPGFETPTAFELGKVALSVDYKSLLTDKIRVRRIEVRAPKVTYEAGLRGSNVSALLKNVEAFTGPSSPSSSGSAPKLQIDRFDFTGGRVSVSAKLMKGKAVTAALPPIHLEGLGAGKEGVTPGDAAKVVFRSISGAVVKAVANVPGLDAAVDAGKKAVGEVKQQAGKAVGGLKSLFKKKK